MSTDKTVIGSSFDDFLESEGILEESSAIAMKRVIAWQLAQAMKSKGLSKLLVAERMGTSRSHLDRILDATDAGLTLETLSKAAKAVGCQVSVKLTDSDPKSVATAG